MTNRSSSLWRPPLLVVIGALYLAQGIPLGLTVEALPALLRARGVSLETLALLPAASLPWMIKFLWAPLVDNHWLGRFGRRRSWILPAQVIVVVSLLVAAMQPVEARTIPIVVVLLAVSMLATATQDIATDGLAAERLSRSQMAVANSLQIGGMMAGMLVGGAGMLILNDQVGFSMAVVVLAALIVLTALPVLLWKEPLPDKDVHLSRARLIEFFRRRDSWALALVMLVFAISRTVNISLSKVFLVDHGWSLSQIGAIVVSGNSLLVIVGAALAGILVRLLGAVTISVAGVVVVMMGGGYGCSRLWTAERFPSSSLGELRF